MKKDKHKKRIIPSSERGKQESLSTISVLKHLIKWKPNESKVRDEPFSAKVHSCTISLPLMFTWTMVTAIFSPFSGPVQA